MHTFHPTPKSQSTCGSEGEVLFIDIRLLSDEPMLSSVIFSITKTGGLDAW